MSFHIGAKPGEIAETVLLPGDPYRARWAARTFLDGAVLVNEVRGMLGYTGTWRGHRVTIHGTGMGMPSMSIYANELIRDHGARVLIRIGSAGAMQPDVGLRDVVLAMAASTEGSPSRSLFREVNFAPTADFDLLTRAHAKAHAGAAGRARVHVGMVHSSDTFYDERQDLSDQLRRHRCLAVEMETAELYTLAARHGARALSVLTISDHVLTGEALPAEEREKSFGAMVEIALAAAFGG
ncbi:purine-nucleoside phosphorylase [Pseudogemmobacter sonorensis]|uniref:purine-nucleoside phosphorylase n=1 Tax=Pseudogemmobacter sonorensis TaxID=2989681 RepID=UPI0036CB7DA7